MADFNGNSMQTVIRRRRFLPMNRYIPYHTLRKFSGPKMIDLSDEILIKVAKHLSNNSDLLNLSLVSSRMRNIGQEVLFNNVRLTKSRGIMDINSQPARFMRTILTSKALGSLVRHLLVEGIEPKEITKQFAELIPLILYHSELRRSPQLSSGMKTWYSQVIHNTPELFDTYYIMALLVHLPGLRSLKLHRVAGSYLFGPDCHIGQRRITPREVLHSQLSRLQSLIISEPIESRGSIIFDRHMLQSIPSISTLMLILPGKTSIESRQQEDYDPKQFEGVLNPFVKVLVVRSTVLIGPNTLRTFTRSWPSITEFTLDLNITAEPRWYHNSYPSSHLDTYISKVSRGLQPWAAQLQRLSVKVNSSQRVAQAPDRSKQWRLDEIKQEIIRRFFEDENFDNVTRFSVTYDELLISRTANLELVVKLPNYLRMGKYQVLSTLGSKRQRPGDLHDAGDAFTAMMVDFKRVKV